MATLQQRGATMLSRTHKAAGGFVGTYYRNQTATPDLTATVAEKEYQEVDVDGQIVGTFLSYDWTFTAADLSDEPRVGDLWKPTINGTEETYEVVEVQGRAARRLDTSGILLTVHTNKVR